MAVLDILVAPHPVLSARARAVRPDEFGPALSTLLSDMAESMYAAPGVGLAAPQVGDGRRIVVLDPDDREKRGRRLHKMVNPEIVERSRETIHWNETCLSVPDFELDVIRNQRIRVIWQDEQARPVEAWFSDYEAVIVQHELDHLLGTVLLDRVSVFRRSRWLKKTKRSAEAALAR